ncbi:MAG TPA: tryptophan synthase subunit alpha [Gammaproteobacteria bacterium]|nr:tryptophan synthase subunit alpha [Gammaproteobacteria bacterium]
MLPRDKIRAALTRGASAGNGPGAKRAPALVAFITAGYPQPSEFLNVLRAVATAADAVEIGVPFSDPMADGVTIQRSSQHAIEHGVSLKWILDELARRDYELASPVLLMSYLNPLLAFGLDELAARAAEVGVSGVIVPDLPYEESAPLRTALDSHGLALVQLVTPATPPERLRSLCAASQGFVYAVTRTGITGGESTLPAETSQYLAAVKAASQVPVCAGFGVRRPDQVATIARYADGVIVGSALVEVLERGEDPARFLRSLRG